MCGVELQYGVFGIEKQCYEYDIYITTRNDFGVLDASLNI